MHADISAKLNDFAKKRINDVSMAMEYEALKKSLMHTEIMLGDAENEYDANDKDYEGYLEAHDVIWGDVCSAAMKQAKWLADDSQSFANDLNLNADEMRNALHDNYVYGALAAAFAARNNGSMKKLPLLAAAAFNKNKYAGYHDEIACLRMLLWAGFDPNAQDSNGMTALHYMAALKVNAGSHPRAVRLLLAAGINPNLKNANGDTTLCYLAGNTAWRPAHNETAWMLLQNGADPLVKANDGESAYSLWKKNQGTSADLAEIVAIIEKVAEPQQSAAGGGDEAYYTMVGKQVCNLLSAGDAKEIFNFFGYMMAINIAKELGEDDQFAKRMAPRVAEGLDAAYLIDTLAPYFEEGDTVAVGKLTYAYLAEAAEARFDSFKASMQAE